MYLFFPAYSVFIFGFPSKKVHYDLFGMYYVIKIRNKKRNRKWRIFVTGGSSERI